MLGFGKNKKNKETEKNSLADKMVAREYTEEVSAKVNIHVMPERFRTAHAKKAHAKKMGVFIIVGGILFLIAASALLYFFVIKGTFSPNKSQIATTTESASEPKKEEKPVFEEPKKEEKPVVEEKTPEESYKEIKTELDLAESFSRYEAAIYKYGSKMKINLFEKEKEQYSGTSEAFKENMVSLVVQQKMPKLRDIDANNIKTEVNGDTATITVVTRDQRNSGTVKLVKEDDTWKLESESWAEVVEAEEVKEEVSLMDGIDSDGDGLTDKEEAIFGSNKDNIDSDGDGYGDLSEIYNLYDPVSNKKLVESGKITKYVNSTYSYNLYYPSSWTASTVGGDFSISIKSDDNHFIQIMSEYNTSKEPIEEWYKKQFSVSTIDGSKIVKGENWKGIKTDDGLTIYITDDELIYIFTITYNPGTSNTAEYKNIYKMVLDSFEINANQ